MEGSKKRQNISIKEKLFALKDDAYRDFQAPLMPTVDKERIIGVRTPALRSLANALAGTDEAKLFIQTLPHDYYEEDNLHAFLLEKIKDFETLKHELLRFLPYIDNWATCDSMVPKLFKRHPEGLFEFASELMDSPHTYTVRYGIGILMRFFLDEKFTPEVLRRVAKIESNNYYISMMQAWFFQVAILKQRESALPYLKEHKLSVWVHNKTISKCIDSYRFTSEDKAFFKSLKR